MEIPGRCSSCLRGSRSLVSPQLRLGAALFNYFDSEICSLVGRLEGDSPDLLSQIREEAMAARIIAILHAIERHAAAVAAEPGPAVAEHFLARYRRHVTEHHDSAL
jgi:hypothetical protein